MAEKLCVLGSTGSIGKQALEVAKELNIKVTALAAKSNILELENQIREFKPEYVCVFDENYAQKLKNNTKDLNFKIFTKIDGLCEISAIEPCDLVLNAVVGRIGLQPTLSAINSKKNVALANKETLVAGGEIVMRAAKKNNVQIIPVDSEHSAIFQCLQSNKNMFNDNISNKGIKKLILTASGGPFFKRLQKELEDVTIKETLNHPNWKMGAKITVDCATMMNKGLEIIEAVHLFGINPENIDVVIHRESVIHSMVEFVDNSVIAQMGVPSMKLPIQYAFTYPERVSSQAPVLNLSKYQKLSFFEPDYKTFECLNICKDAIKIGKSLPIVVNAANEEAVKLYLNNEIKFLEIQNLVKNSVKNHKIQEINNLKDIVDIDEKTRNEFINNKDKTERRW